MIISSGPLRSTRAVPAGRDGRAGTSASGTRTRATTRAWSKIDFLGARDALAGRGVRGADRAAAGTKPIDSQPHRLRRPKVYEMICDGDTVGVFQIESRAQIADAAAHAAAQSRGSGGAGRDRAAGTDRRRRGATRTCAARERPTRPRALLSEVPDERVRERSRRPSASSSSRTRCCRSARQMGGFSPGRRKGFRRAMSRKSALRGRSMDGYREQIRRRAPPGSRCPRPSAEKMFEALDGLLPSSASRSRTAAAFALLAYQSAWLQALLRPGVHVRAVQRAADGLLPAGDPRPGCTAARVEVLPPDVSVSAARCEIEGGAVASASAHLLGREGRCGGPRRGARQPGRSATSLTSLAVAVLRDALDALVKAALATASGSPGASSSGSSASSSGRSRCRVRAARRSSSRCAIDPTTESTCAPRPDALGAHARRLRHRALVGRTRSRSSARTSRRERSRAPTSSRSHTVAASRSRG